MSSWIAYCTQRHMRRYGIGERVPAGRKTLPCQKACLYQAIRRDETGKIIIDPKACTGCEACIDACQGEQLLASRDTPAMLLRMKEHTGPVYAMVAPAFLGQFGKATPGQLRTAFKQLGFQGMVEVAAFADILTMKEALEFDANIHTDRDFLLTSCCCPLWISMIRKVYAQLIPHVPGSVSPMVACGRVIKRLHENAMTVFIGPCLAKKAEAREEVLSTNHCQLTLTLAIRGALPVLRSVTYC